MGYRQCDVRAMMSGALLLLALALASSAAPAQYDDGPSEIVIPQKRAALVLDRILIALQKALHEPRDEPLDGPRAVALRGPFGDLNDMKALHEPRGELLDGPLAVALRGHFGDLNDMSSLQRRGQAGAAGRGRVLRCYFNAVTCF